MKPFGLTYRPITITDMIGNENLIRDLQKKMKDKSLPNRLLITGPTGTGKTTLAYILFEYFTGQEFEASSPNVMLINGGASGGIDTIRSAIEKVSYVSLIGKCNVVIIDEAHKLTPAAVNAILVPLEDETSTVWILLTDQPGSLPATVRGRLNKITLEAPSVDDMLDLADFVCKEESITYREKMCRCIAENCGGNVRLFLNVMQDLAARDNVTAADVKAQVLRHMDAERSDKIENLISILRNDIPKDVLSIMEIYGSWIAILLYALDKHRGNYVASNFYYDTVYEKITKKLDEDHLEEAIVQVVRRMNKARTEVIQGGVDARAAYVAAFFA